MKKLSVQPSLNPLEHNSAHVFHAGGDPVFDREEVKLRQYLSWFRNAAADRDGKATAKTDTPVASVGLLQDEANIPHLEALMAVFRESGDLIECLVDEAAFFGVEPNSLMGAGFLTNVHVADRPVFLKALSEAVHGGARTRAEVRFQTSSIDEAENAFVWLELICAPVAARDNSQDCEPAIVVSGQDVSRFKAREEELSVAAQAALEANEAKTRYLNTMSHELRTPLNAIIGFSEMMCVPGIVVKNERQMNEYAGIIHESGKHLLGLVDEVLDMSRLESGKYRLEPENFKVAELVSTALELVQHEAEAKGVRITVRDIDPDLVLYSDWRASRQLLVNLFARQIKRTVEKGRVRLSLEVTAEALGITVVNPRGETLAEGETKLTGSLMEKLADLLGGRVRLHDVDADGQIALQVHLPLTFGKPLADDKIFRLSSKPSTAQMEFRQTA